MADLTAQQLHDIVKANPEAWPEGCDFVEGGNGYKPHWTLDNGTADFCAITHAVMLHEAAAMRYYLQRQKNCKFKSALIWLRDDGLWSVRRSEDSDSDGAGPTLIEALHKAITESKKWEGR